MAVERKPKTLRVDLAHLINQQIQIHQVIMKRSHDMQDSKFLMRVRDEGLSYSDQLEYYQRTLANEEGKRIQDGDYIKQVKESISKAKQLVRSDKFRKDYQAEIEAVVSGNKSIQEHLDFLQSELNSAVDPEIKNTINEGIVEAKKAQYQIQKNIIDNKVALAKVDKTKEVLNSVLSEVKSKRSQALERGDDEWVSALDVSISSLEQQIATTQMEDEIADFITSSINSTNPLDRVNNFNAAIAGADMNTPVRINSVLYNSAKDYWEQEKGLYFATGKFGNEFNRFFKDKIDAIETASQEALPAELKRLKKEMEAFAGKEDLAAYKDTIQTQIDNALGYGANLAGQNIVNQAYMDYNFVGASRKLASLNKDIGIDMTDHYNSIINKVSELNFDQAQRILDNAASYASKTGASQEAALDYAIQWTPDLIFAPSDLASRDPSEVAKGAAGIGDTEIAKGSVKVDPNADIGGKTGQRPTEQYAVGSYIKVGGSDTVFRVEGGNKITPLVGAWTEEDFKKFAGHGFDKIKTVGDLGGSGLNLSYKYQDKFGEKSSAQGIVSPTYILQQEAIEQKRLDKEAAIARQRESDRRSGNQPPAGGGTPPPSGGGTPTGLVEGTRYKNPDNAEIFLYKGGQLSWIKDEPTWKLLYGDTPIEGNYQDLPQGGYKFGTTITKDNFLDFK